MKLSPNFSLAEMTRTSYPRLQDSPPVDVVCSLVFLCAVALQPLRDFLGEPVSISSGYRSAALNSKVGGVSGSFHRRGLAADIVVCSEDDARRKFEFLRQLPYVDSVLFEHRGHSRWLHVQVSFHPRHISNFNFLG